MAQTIVTLCDVHLADGTEVPGVTWGVGLQPPGSRWGWFLLDLCPDHAQGLQVAPADGLEFLTKFGRTNQAPTGSPTGSATGSPTGSATGSATRSGRPKAPGQLTGPQTCPVCGFVSRNRSALSSHVTSRHPNGKTLDQLEGLDTPHACPHCTKAYRLPQSLALHVTRIHGAAGASKRAAGSAKT